MQDDMVAARRVLWVAALDKVAATYLMFRKIATEQGFENPGKVAAMARQLLAEMPDERVSNHYNQEG